MARTKTVPRKVKDLVDILIWHDDTLTGKEIKDKVETKWPEVKYTERTYQTLKSEVIKQKIEIKAGPLERAWSLGVMSDENMPIDIRCLSPEALRAISSLQAAFYTDEFYKWPVSIEHNMILSVRDVRWIARICPDWKGLFDKEYESSQLDDISTFFIYYRTYALLELVNELAGNKTLDTFELDKAIATDNLVNPNHWLNSFGKNLVDASVAIYDNLYKGTVSNARND